MVPATPAFLLSAPSRLHPATGALPDQLQAVIFYCDKRLSCFLYNETTHEPKVLRAMNVYCCEGVFAARKHDEFEIHLWAVCFGRGHSSKEPQLQSMQVILFFYWKCTQWMFCARVKWHFNTTQSVSFFSLSKSSFSVMYTSALTGCKCCKKSKEGQREKGPNSQLENNSS